jgi:flagellar hook-associated protein 1 FlgK
MISTFAGVEIGKRGMVAHNQGLNTVGHNLTNSSTEGYSRQRVEMAAFEPLYAPELNREETPGQIGQGAVVERVERVRDMLLESRIDAQTSDEGFWSTRDSYALQLEQIYNEPTDSSTRSHLDRFWDSWQELSAHPEEMAARQAVLSRGQSLLDAVKDRYGRLSGLREQVDQDIRSRVAQVNAYSSQIADLNREIVKSKALGDSPNDLLDRRDLLIEKLGSIIDITTDGRDPDEYMVHTGGRILIQGKQFETFSLGTDEANDGMTKVTWGWSGDKAEFRSGSMASLMVLRDGDIKDEIQGLDVFAVNFSDLVNEIHRAGYGLNGKTGQDFFTERPYVNNLAGNYDSDGDGNYDSTRIYRMTGGNALDPREQVGLEGTMVLPGKAGTVAVDYHPADTVADVVDKINRSGAEVSARLDRSGRLELKALPAVQEGNPDFVIRSLEDSGEFLAGYSGLLSASGPAGAYDWGRADAALGLRVGGVDFAVTPQAHPSGWLEINPALKSDLTSIATGFGVNGARAESGDGSAALAVASLRNSAVMAGGSATFDAYFQDAVARAGLRGEQAGQASEDQSLIMKQLRDLRESISGVNVDEELSQMIKFQHGYAAAAKFIATVNDMLDTIINRMGV